MWVFILLQIGSFQTQTVSPDNAIDNFFNYIPHSAAGLLVGGLITAIRFLITEKTRLEGVIEKKDLAIRRLQHRLHLSEKESVTVQEVEIMKKIKSSDL